MSAAEINFTTLRKEVRYERSTRDYSLWIDDRYVGSAPTHTAATTRLDELVSDMLTHNAIPVSSVAVAVAHSAEDATTSFAVGQTEVCIHDDQAVSIYVNAREMTFASPRELAALRALVHIVSTPEVHAAIMQSGQ